MYVGGSGPLVFAWSYVGDPDEIRNWYIQSTRCCYAKLPQVFWLYPLKTSCQLH